MPTNHDRAEWAAAALRHFQSATGTDYDNALPDLLCDLMHWSDREDFNFHDAIDTARMHYEAECEEEAAENNPQKPKATTLPRNAAMTIAQTAIYANFEALAERLAEAAKLSAEAAAAIKDGKQNQAIGTALPLENLLSQSKALYDAALALHRHASRG
jgi:hypothetical protein